jgi:hypothetical protein
MFHASSRSGIFRVGADGGEVFSPRIQPAPKDKTIVAVSKRVTAIIFILFDIGLAPPYQQ